MRSLRASQLERDTAGAVFFTIRGKTTTPVGGALNDRALAALEAYVARLGVELHGDAFIFRNRGGAPYSKDTLGDDFRDVRAAAFGEGERRTLADFRRSGAVEAIVGGARAEELAHAMGNTLGASNALFSDLRAGQRGDTAQRYGGAPPGPRQADENKTAQKVGTRRSEKLEQRNPGELSI